MKHASLFSGIGGFDYAAELIGWENVFHCEINPFCQKILQFHFPNSICYTDIKKTDFTIHANKIDILTGGFPCQPFSQAGKRKGTNDERYLWPEMLRAIREIKPRWIVGENVRGIVNWSDGMVFDEICSDLEIEGYEIQPFLLPAASVNAPHKRERVWFIAYSESQGTRRVSLKSKKKRSSGCNELLGKCCGILDNFRSIAYTNCDGQFECNCKNENFASKTRVDAFSNVKPSLEHGLNSNTNCFRFGGETNWPRKARQFNQKSSLNNWENFPTQSPICIGDDGLSSKLDGITFSKWRSESIKGAGNAIVPNVFIQICKAIQEFEKQFESN